MVWWCDGTYVHTLRPAHLHHVLFLSSCVPVVLPHSISFVKQVCPEVEPHLSDADRGGGEVEDGC